jgi:uncharacterized membrane protein YeaQ/YmgE (transglycosylase-associated protein family)
MNDKNYPERIRNVTNYTGNPIDTLLILATVTISIIVSFAWRDAMDKFIMTNFDSVKSRVQAKFTYAITATIGAIILIYLFSYIRRR